MSDTERNILAELNSPDDLKKLSVSDLENLACEIRRELISVISENGGHLAPNLGVVELTIALHRVFNAPDDKILWDVGHQGYVHKLLTGRRDFFRTLRKDNGCLGFLSREESEYDVFGAGHAGTAVSAAAGLAAARDLKGEDFKIAAVVGDGSLNCGATLEGLNNVAEVTDDLLIIINDNKMSISPNVGAMARYLNRIISARPYNRFKAFVRKLVRAIPLVGDEITHKIARLEEAAKSMFVPGVIFEELGLRYIGPVDGHDIEELIRTLGVVREFEKPTVLHVLTEKGRGYEPAEAAPEKFHGLSSFDPDTGLEVKGGGTKTVTFSSAFGDAVAELAEKHENVAAITAAMRSGTGLAKFAEKFPDRFFDVGIAEEHALIFAAGMAVEGVRPVVAVYSSFLQRALDYVYHDICLQHLPVIICTDRSGIVDDGPTHHGIYDIAFLKSVPELAVLSPSDGEMLKDMLFAAYEKSVPVVIRYPKGCAEKIVKKAPPLEWGKAGIIREGGDVALWAVGGELKTAVAVAEILEKKNIKASVIDVRFLKPFDESLFAEYAEKMPVVTIEDAVLSGGLASITDSLLTEIAHKGVIHFGWDDEIIPHGTTEGIRSKYGMTPESIAGKIMEQL